jgi:hypothetical protein
MTFLISAWLASVALDEAPAAYPGSSAVQIGGELRVDGDAYRLAYFVTADPLPRVLGHFFELWKERGLPTRVEGDLREEAVVSAFDTRRGLQWAVVLRQRAGRTWAFSAARELWAPPVTPDPAPLVRVEGSLFSEVGVSPGARTDLVLQPAHAVHQAVLDRLAAEGDQVIGDRQTEEVGRVVRVIEVRSAQAYGTVVVNELDATSTVVTQRWSERR